MRGLIGSVVTLAVVGAGTAALAGQGGSPYELKVVRFEKGKVAATGDKAPPAADEENIHTWGKQGWDVIFATPTGYVMKRDKKLGLPVWNYKLIKAPESQFSGKGDDNEVLLHLIEGLVLQSWQPVSSTAGKDGNSLLFKRIGNATERAPK